MYFDVFWQCVILVSEKHHRVFFLYSSIPTSSSLSCIASLNQGLCVSASTCPMDTCSVPCAASIITVWRAMLSWFSSLLLCRLLLCRPLYRRLYRLLYRLLYHHLYRHAHGRLYPVFSKSGVNHFGGEAKEDIQRKVHATSPSHLYPYFSTCAGLKTVCTQAAQFNRQNCFTHLDAWQIKTKQPVDHHDGHGLDHDLLASRAQLHPPLVLRWWGLPNSTGW